MGGFIDYGIEYEENIICVTESKQLNTSAGVAQNFVQLDSALQVSYFIWLTLYYFQEKFSSN